MKNKLRIEDSTLSLIIGDITNIDIDSFVFYARDDLDLGSGFGSAISLRGGPSVRKELETAGAIKVTGAIATTAGNMKAKYIIHANGPKFQEEDTEQKLEATINNALKCAEKIDVNSIAFPPMGAGFYGVPLDVSAVITIKSLVSYIKNGTRIKEIVICAVDNREYGSLAEELKNFMPQEISK